MSNFWQELGETSCILEWPCDPALNRQTGSLKNIAEERQRDMEHCQNADDVQIGFRRHFMWDKKFLNSKPKGFKASE